MTGERIHTETIEEAVRNGLAPYAGLLAATGRFSIDIEQAATLSPRTELYGTDSMHSTTPIVDAAGQEEATVDILVISPGTSPGRDPLHHRRTAAMYEAGQPGYVLTNESRDMHGRLGLLSIAAFDTTRSEPRPVLHLMNLRQVAGNGYSVGNLAMHGQMAGVFQEMLDSTDPEVVVPPLASQAVDGRFDTFGDTGFVNLNMYALQVVGVVATNDKIGPPGQPSVMEALGMRPSELWADPHGPPMYTGWHER